MLGRGLADPLPLDLWIFQMLAVTGVPCVSKDRYVGRRDDDRWISLDELFFGTPGNHKKLGHEMGTLFFLGGGGRNPKLMLKCMIEFEGYALKKMLHVFGLVKY